MSKKELDDVILKSFSDSKNVNILNVAGGKCKPQFLSGENTEFWKVVNLDRMYLNSIDISYLKGFMDKRINKYNKNDTSVYVNHEIFDFLSRFQFNFDIITCYRFLEHVKKTDVLYFIYLLSTTVKVGGFVDMIVPDYEWLAHKILTEDPYDKDFEADDILTTFELLNEPYDPHSSIWTEKRIHRFFTLEGRFEIVDLAKSYDFDGRDVYIRFVARRIK